MENPREPDRPTNGGRCWSRGCFIDFNHCCVISWSARRVYKHLWYRTCYKSGDVSGVSKSSTSHSAIGIEDYGSNGLPPGRCPCNLDSHKNMK